MSMSKVLLNEIYSNLLDTGTALLLMIVVYFLAIYLGTRKIDSRRQRKHFKIRAFYVTVIIFLFLMARIWVEGFTHLLAVLGFVSAALVITNKETIMNFVGWLVITWRDLFAEEDLIQILQYKGYVKSIGLLYFTLSEVSGGVHGNVSGRVIRIPNGLVANNALINFSQNAQLLEQHFSIVFTRESNVDDSIKLVCSTVDNIITRHYANRKEFSMLYLGKKNKHLVNRINLEANVSVHPKSDAPAGVELTVYYYCFIQDADKIQQTIWVELLANLKDNATIAISYEA